VKDEKMILFVFVCKRYFNLLLSCT